MRPIDHWIAFALLAAFGIYTAAMALRRRGADEPAARRVADPLVLDAAVSCMDALIVGPILGLLNEDAVPVAVLAGVTASAAAVLDLTMARRGPKRIERIPRLSAGALVIGGGVILYRRLNAA